MNAEPCCKPSSAPAVDRRLRGLAAVLVAVLAACAMPEPAAPVAVVAADAPPLERLKDRIARDDQSYAHIASLVTDVGPRFAGSDTDLKAVGWAVAKMRALGLANVRTEAVSVPHWVRGDLKIGIVGGASLTAVALGGSAPTPEGGLEAPVVQVGSLEELEYLPDSKVRGSIVFLDHRMQRAADGSGYAPAVRLRAKGPTRAARKGALAVVIRSVGTDNQPDAHTGATQYEDTAPKIPCAAFTQPAADALEQALAQGNVKLRIDLQSKTLPDADSANVIGEVPGATDEVVLLAAHLDSWDTAPGANDDGAGVGIVLEAARQILQSGLKPHRTIRVVLYANEEFGLSGSKAYAAAHGDELDKHVIAMEADFGSAPVIALNARVPQPAWTQVQAMARAAGVPVGSNGNNGGADLWELRKKGVPMLEPAQDGTRYFDVHHTVRDTLDRVDRAGLTQNVTVYATLAWLAAESADGFGRLDVINRGPQALAWKDLDKQPLPAEGMRIAYGKDPLQLGELRVPEGAGPFPVAVVVHGGCWLKDYDYKHATRLAQALTASGIATWTIEYRKVGDPGGGWPNTFLDVAHGTDFLEGLAKKHKLDLHRTIAIGHSAGGQLALWLAGRSALPPASPLYRKRPFALRGVLALAPITDLAAYAASPGCGEAVAPLMGGTPGEQAARYGAVSPMLLPPPAVPVRVLHGVYDTVVPIGQSQKYVLKAEGARLQALDDLGHFELVTPASNAWPQVINAARELLGS